MDTATNLRPSLFHQQRISTPGTESVLINSPFLFSNFHDESTIIHSLAYVSSVYVQTKNQCQDLQSNEHGNVHNCRPNNHCEYLSHHHAFRISIDAVLLHLHLVNVLYLSDLTVPLHHDVPAAPATLDKVHGNGFYAWNLLQMKLGLRSHHVRDCDRTGTTQGRRELGDNIRAPSMPGIGT